MHTEALSASPWVMRWSHLVSASQTLLDVACGTGRHVQYFAQKGCKVTAIEISRLALDVVAAHSPTARLVEADIENQPWPLNDEKFDAIVVTNYLHRSLMPTLLSSLKDGGVLIYETFAVGNEAFGKPSRPDFLLKSKELLSICESLHVMAYEEGFLSQPGRMVQRIVAVNRTAKMPVLSETTQFHL